MQKNILHAPAWRLFLMHFCAISLIAFTFRVLLIFLTESHMDLHFRSYFVLGFLFDLATAIYSFVPFAFIFLAFPNSLLRRIRFQRLMFTILFFDLTFFGFFQIAEYYFFDEFRDRFNFIAVDYLVYSHEVLRNIWESYNVLPIIAGLLCAAGFLSFFVVKMLTQGELEIAGGLKRRFLFALIYAIVFAVTFAKIEERKILSKESPSVEMIAKNGVHALFSAYRNNEIPYDRFYSGIDEKKAYFLVHDKLEGKNKKDEHMDLEDEISIVRNLNEPGEPKTRNVVVVVMESLSARFMGVYGNQDHLTPNLDQIARDGIFFDNLYATGTRTVRGLEAITLSIPPTPGQSIVRRPAGKGLFNIGTVFRQYGYMTRFIYGGRAAFDNMGAFFEGNGFEVLDQSNFPSEDVGFSNAWGVSDEDLFAQVLKMSDSSAERGEKFFHLVLTTSNHRPYTFPNGRIERKSGAGRLAAVQYTDFAIGDFLKKASQRKWYDSTLFVFVSDHNASVAGGSQISPDDYLIPFIIYNPKLVTSLRVSSLASQIDVPTTILGLLNFSYQSRFFGMELLEDAPHRAFLGTYQKISYLTEDSMVTLSPIFKIERFDWDNHNLRFLESEVARTVEPANQSEELAVAFYKTASDWFRQGLLNENLKFSRRINPRW